MAQNNNVSQQLPNGGYPVRHHSAFIEGFNSNNNNAPKYGQSHPNNMNPMVPYPQSFGVSSNSKRVETLGQNPIIKKHS